MSTCTDKRFEEMLPRYELNLLSDTDCAAFEEHLYHCDSCFAKVSETQDSARALRFDSRVRARVAQLAGEQTSPSDRLVDLKAKWLAWPRLVRVAAIVLPIIAVMLIIPWQIELHRSDEVTAARPRVGIAVVENLAPSEDTLDIGRIAERLLSVGLAESGRLSILAPEVIDQYATRLGVVIGRTDNTSQLLTLADSIHADYLVIGSILQTTPTISAAVSVLDVASRELAFTERIDGLPDESPLGTLDRLARLVGRRLAVPDSAMYAGKSLADLTTHSLAAYRHYTRGLEFRKRHAYDSARTAFSGAIANDSSFAMAYYYLWFYAPDNACESFLQSALAHVEHADNRSQRFIRSLAARTDRKWNDAIRELTGILDTYPDDVEALVALGAVERYAGRFAESEARLREALKTDSLCTECYGELAATLSANGRLADALAAVHECIRLEPDNANSYDTKGEILLLRGEIDSARWAFEKALTLDSMLPPARLHLIQLHLLAGQPDPASGHIDHLRRLGSFNYPSLANYYDALIAVRTGRLGLALRLTDEGIASDQEKGLLSSKLRKLFFKATILAEIDSLDEALSVLDRCDLIHRTVRPDDKLGYNAYRARILAQAGRFDEASEIARSIRLDISDSAAVQFGFNSVQGAIATARGDWQKASEYFTKALTSSPRSYVLLSGLARADLGARRASESATRFEGLLSRFDTERLTWSTLDIESHYYLGMAYEATNRKTDAAAQYHTFLQAWGNSDYRLAIVTDARERLTRLESTP